MSAFFKIISVHFCESYALFVFAATLSFAFQLRLNLNFRLVRLWDWELVHLVILLGYISIKLFYCFFIKHLQIWQAHEQLIAEFRLACALVSINRKFAKFAALHQHTHRVLRVHEIVVEET